MCDVINVSCTFAECCMSSYDVNPTILTDLGPTWMGYNFCVLSEYSAQKLEPSTGASPCPMPSWRAAGRPSSLDASWERVLVWSLDYHATEAACDS